MAVGPKMALDAFNEEVARFEEHFDAQLSTRKLESGGTAFIACPDDCNSKHFDALRVRYIDAGWADVQWSPGGYGSKSGINFSTKKLEQ